MRCMHIEAMGVLATIAMAFGLQGPAAAGASEDALKAISTSSLTLTTSSAVIALPAQVSLTATVVGTALKGNVTFRSGTTDVGVAAINKNAATATVTLSPAIHSLTAVFTAADGMIVSAPVRVVVDNALTCG
jgi:hypothetical protein